VSSGHIARVESSSNRSVWSRTETLAARETECRKDRVSELAGLGQIEMCVRGWLWSVPIVAWLKVKK
jgi:hypothetical protein